MNLYFDLRQVWKEKETPELKNRSKHVHAILQHATLTCSGAEA